MTDHPTTARARRAARWWPLVTGGVAIALALGLGLLASARTNPLWADTEWMEEIVEHRSVWWDTPARVMSFLGGGWFGVIVVPVAAVIVLLLLRRRWAALYFGLASILSAGLVQLLKNLFDRARPEEILIAADFGAFPSGHVANAATIAVALGFIVARTWVWVAGVAYTVLMMLSRTYLGAHWLTDTIGGLLLGAAVAVILWAPLAAKLGSESSQQGNSVKE